MTIGIIGLGLIGGSMAKALKFYTTHTVYGMDTDGVSLKRAVLVGAIDDVLTEERLPECDVILSALYPKATVAFITNHGACFKKGAIVIDLCGVKQTVCEPCFIAAEQHGFHYVGGHPMAGTQFSGFQNARETLFRDASMILVAKPNEDIFLLDRIKQLFTSIGFTNVTLTDAQTHDRMIAYTSQLAHIVSNAYVKSPQAQGHKGFSAGSYKDLTRVARLNEDMWTELFLENKTFLAEELDLLIANLEAYSSALRQNDSAALKQLLRDGRILKEQAEDESLSATN